MGELEEMIYVVCVRVTEGYSGNGCDLASTLCKYDLRKGDMSEAGKYLFRAANMWWRCAQYLYFVARCLETLDVCIWRMFIFMSVVVILWSLWECLLCSGRC